MNETARKLTELSMGIDQLMGEANWGIGSERIAGNVVKEQFWKGQLSASKQIKSAMDRLFGPDARKD